MINKSTFARLRKDSSGSGNKNSKFRSRLKSFQDDTSSARSSCSLIRPPNPHQDTSKYIQTIKNLY